MQKPIIKRLLIDMDAVTADILSHWLPLINEEFGDSLTKENVTVWDIEKISKGGKGVLKFIYEPGFFANLQPIEGAIETLEKLHLEGFEVYYVTAAPLDSATACKEKADWVAKYTPFIPQDHIIFTHKKDLINGDILFDDAPKNLKTFPNIPVAFDYPFNRDFDGHRVKNWDEFYNLVHTLNNK